MLNKRTEQKGTPKQNQSTLFSIVMKCVELFLTSKIRKFDIKYCTTYFFAVFCLEVGFCLLVDTNALYKNMLYKTDQCRPKSELIMQIHDKNEAFDKLYILLHITKSMVISISETCINCYPFMYLLKCRPTWFFLINTFRG